MVQDGLSAERGGEDDKKIMTLEDDWTVVTQDRKPSAHFEHNVVVKKEKAEILSNFEIIEEEIKKNKELLSVV